MTARDLHSLLAHAAGADLRSDAELLAAARDPAALAALVRRHGPLVWATARRMLPEPADAADAFQAVFLALTKSANRIRTPAAVGGWLHAATVRVCLKQRRTLARRRLREKRAARPEATVPVADAAWDAILAAVHEEIDRLPAGERTAFVVCELQGVPAGEAAKRLGWKPGTLTGRLSKARAKLLTKLSARGLAPAVGLAGAGTLAVPAEVAALALPTAGVSPAVLALSAEVTAMVATKHLAAAVLVTAGLLAGVGGVALQADGPGIVPNPPQLPPLPAPQPRPGAVPVFQPPAPTTRVVPQPQFFPPDQPAVPATPARWEHQTVSKPDTAGEFDLLLAARGRDGWEFAGTVAYAEPAGGADVPGMGGMGGAKAMRTVTLLVFKRLAALPAVSAPLLPAFTQPAGSVLPPTTAPMQKPVTPNGQQPVMANRQLGRQNAAIVAEVLRKSKAVSDQVYLHTETATNTLTLFGPRAAVADGLRLLDLIDPGSIPQPALPPIAPPVAPASPTPPARTGTLTYDFKHIRAESVSAMVSVIGYVREVRVDAATNRLTVVVKLPEPSEAVEDRIGTLRQLLQRADQPPAGAGDGKFVSLPLKHAKAIEVARTVEKLLAPSEGEQNLTGVASRFVATADERRNVLLFKVDGTGRPTEQQVRDLVKELDVPAK